MTKERIWLHELCHAAAGIAIDNIPINIIVNKNGGTTFFKKDSLLENCIVTVAPYLTLKSLKIEKTGYELLEYMTQDKNFRENIAIFEDKVYHEYLLKSLSKVKNKSCLNFKSKIDRCEIHLKNAGLRLKELLGK